MKYFIATISPRFPKNYDTCKALGLWGMTNLKVDAELVRKGDKILFYLGGVGFISIAEAEESVRKLSGNDWKPYDPRNFEWGFKIKFIEEFDEPHRYSFPGGKNPETGIRSSDFQFKAFFQIDEIQYEKIKRAEGAGRISPKAKKEIEKGFAEHQIRTIVGDLINFEGLIFGPVNEQGVIFLFSKIQKELGFVIESIQTGFPDARGRIKTNKGWREVWIEFEFRSSSYLVHGHPLEIGTCDYIVCWEDDWKKAPPHLQIIELKTELEKITKGSATKILSILL